MRCAMLTTKKQIVEWGMKNINESGYGVDAADMHERCWRCGYVRETQRCHVIPHSLGGPDIPSNYRLLCEECHHEAPNVNDPNAMDEWIRKTCVPNYDTFWKYREILFDVVKETTHHFGHSNLNDSTRKWVEKEFKRRVQEELESRAELARGSDYV